MIRNKTNETYKFPWALARLNHKSPLTLHSKFAHPMQRRGPFGHPSPLIVIPSSSIWSANVSNAQFIGWLVVELPQNWSMCASQPTNQYKQENHQNAWNNPPNGMFANIWVIWRVDVGKWVFGSVNRNRHVWPNVDAQNLANHVR